MLVLLTVGLLPCSALATIFTGWYTGWHGQDAPLSSVSWSKYTHMTYAFATTTNSSSLLQLTPADEDLLPQFVSTAHQHGVKAILSIGGWTGSRYFSTHVSTDERRKAFVDATLGLVAKFGLDGIDFDWEFPNRQGMGCNSVSPASEDVPNFLEYLQLLRSDDRGSKLILSAAVPTQPWSWDFTLTDYFTSTFLNPSNLSSFSSPDPTNSTKSYGSTPAPGKTGYLAAFADVLDWIAIMNYDVWNPAVPYAFSLGNGTSVVTRAGPHSALDDTCTEQIFENSDVSGTHRGSAKTSVDAWTDAGFSKEKIVLGVAAYGHGFFVRRQDAFVNSSSSSSPSGSRTLAPYPPTTPSLTPLGDSWDSGPGLDSCGNQVFAGGLWAYRGLVQNGWVGEDGGEKEGGEMVYRWDECSQTPFVYNPTNETMISYENPRSFGAKGTFIATSGLAGFSIWEVGGDSGDLLLDSIRSTILNSTASPSGSTAKSDANPAMRVMGISGLSLVAVVVGGMGVLALLG